MAEYLAVAQQKWEAFDKFQNSWDGAPLVQYMIDHAELPIFTVSLYFIVVFWLPQHIHKPYSLKPFVAAWNLFLTLFSLVGAYYTIPHLMGMVKAGGIKESMCADPRTGYFLGPPGFWAAMFVLSKVPELMDTVFLVLQKKPVIFLHWFHHATVMLYCWHAYIVLSGPGLWFGAMNYGVHSIMYLYYFFGAIGLRSIVKRFAVLITALQILQMVVGISVTVALTYWSGDEDCIVSQSNNRLALAMYGSYFVLFAQLFKKLYFSPKPKNQAAAAIKKRQ